MHQSPFPFPPEQMCTHVWGARLEGVRKNPPRLAPFLHVYPSHTPLCGWKVVWGQSRHVYTPFGGLFSLLSETVSFAGFSTPPPFAERGVLGPFLHPFCTLCAPFLHPPLCARTPFLHPFCTRYVRWNPLSAPFLWGGFCAKDFCKKGTKCIHRVQIWFLKRTCNAFFFRPLWPCQGQGFAGLLGVVTPRRGSQCSIHG